MGCRPGGLIHIQQVRGIKCTNKDVDALPITLLALLLRTPQAR
jgi:hypothetical protein